MTQAAFFSTRAFLTAFFAADAFARFAALDLGIAAFGFLGANTCSGPFSRSGWFSRGTPMWSDNTTGRDREIAPDTYVVHIKQIVHT